MRGAEGVTRLDVFAKLRDFEAACSPVQVPRRSRSAADNPKQSLSPQRAPCYPFSRRLTVFPTTVMLPTPHPYSS